MKNFLLRLLSLAALGVLQMGCLLGAENTPQESLIKNAYDAHEGIGTPKITVTDAAFQKTNLLRENGPIDVIIKNIGNTQLVITGVKGPNQSAFRTNLADFQISEDNLAFLPPNKELKFQVWFTPGETKTYLDSIVVESDAGDVEDPVCLLTGEGFDDVSAPDMRNSSLTAKVLPNPIDSRGGLLEFENPGDGTVEIVLFNSLNRQVAVLANEWMKAGKRSIRIPVETLPGGAYTYRIFIDNRIERDKFIIDK